MLSSFSCKAQEQPAQISLLVALPKGPPFAHSWFCYQRHLISTECFSRSVMPKLLLCTMAVMDQDLCLMQVLCNFGCHTLGKVITGGYLSSLDAVSFKFLLAIMPRDINWSCFLMFVQSVRMLMLQNISLTQMLWVLLTKCFFFFLLCLPLSIDFWKTSGSNLISSSKYRSS